MSAMACAPKLVLVLFCILNLALGDVNLHTTTADLAYKISTKDYMLVIFCDELESEECQGEIIDLNEHMKDSEDKIAEAFPGLEVIANADEDFSEQYGVYDYPTVAFFRKGIPVVQQVDDSESDVLLEWLQKHKDLHATVLTDSNFEHDTQATTGATTGDWLVLFYENSNALALWEYIAINLAQSKVVARVDVSENPELKARFSNIKFYPTVMMLSQGQMYLYGEDLANVKPLLMFARGGFKRKDGTAIPEPVSTSFFSTIFAPVAVTVLEGSLLGKILVVGGGILLILLIIIVALNKKRKRRAKFD